MRPFAYSGSPFRPGLHRGIHLQAARGEPVHAPCSGRITYAGGFGLTLRCGAYAITTLSVKPRVHAGDDVRAGAVMAKAEGTVHLGVRRAGDPFGYIDPEPLLRRPAPRAPLAPVRSVPTQPRPRLRPPVPSAPLAPWPAWAGFALVLAAVGPRARVVVSRRRWPSTSPRRSST